MARLVCPRCHARLRPGARFCPGCGYRLVERAEDAARRAVLATAWILGSVFAVIVLSSVLQSGEYRGDALYVFEHLFVTLAFLACGLMALPLLGPGSTAASLAGGASPRWIGLGLLAGLANLGLSWAWSELLGAVLDSGAAEVAAAGPSRAALFATHVVLPALAEEWIVRGVLWIALRRIAGPGTTIFGTALVFGFLHGLNGLALLEVPHRFLVGLVLGWVRHRSGSLWPGIAGHGLQNALVVLLLPG